ncbi:hypothetical protein N7509_004346 [Penicillium cosmopolitanum]|uniref:Uncharacterized protein n=1 Tax=Penicillium cosmopolitanum TaxID=1131564 RepID=A0A9W9W6Q9_9EURO|nr:uncharacterized protein N7509_004346 [Penicillium cosmopolitanum]KAJ5404475.1 hypothetical protein N7509_004346 [Penicillium cosmopolitanum]
METVIPDSDEMTSSQQPHPPSLIGRSISLDCASRLRTSDWDLFVPPKKSSISSPDTIERALQTICQFIDESQIIVEEKKSFVLQDPAADTWGSWANKAISFNTKKDGAAVVPVEMNKESPGERPNWIRTIIGLRRGVFKRCPCGIGPAHYKGRLGDYIATVTRDEYKCLEGYCSCEIPTRSDWQDELYATEKKREIVEFFKPELEVDLQHREEEIKEYLNGEAGLYPKGFSLMKREYEDSKPDNANKKPRIQSPLLRPKSSQSHLSTNEVQIPFNAEESETFDGLCTFSPNATGAESPTSTPTESGTMKEPSTGSAIMPSPGASTSLTQDSVIPERPPTPVSTAGCRIKRTPKERQEGSKFISDYVGQGYSYDQIREPYRHEFGIWRSSTALYNHSLNRKRYGGGKSYIEILFDPVRE